MTDDLVKQKRARIRRDMVLSALIGPARVALPALAHVLLYPIILARSGIEVLGLWSLIATLTTYVSLANVGFNSLFIRSVGAAGDAATMAQVARQYTAAVRFCALVGLASLVAWLLVAEPLLALTDVQKVYPRAPLVWSVALQLAAIGFWTVTQIDAAVLTGAHRTWAVQTIDAAVTVARYAVAGVGAVMGRPIEGFCAGAFVGTVLQQLIYRWVLRRRVPEWPGPARHVGLRETFALWRWLIREGWHFYSISVGFVVRGPLFRAVVAAILGLDAAGVYEIASRVPEAVRQLVGVGARALFPAFAHYTAHESRADLQRLVRRVLVLMVGFSFTSFVVYALAAGPLLHLWLHKVPEGLVSATRITTVFWAVNVVAIPYWYLLQANGHERDAAIALWAQTAATALLYPLGKLGDWSLNGMLWFAVVTSVFTQLPIFITAERSAAVVWSTIASRPVLVLTACVTLAGGLSWGVLELLGTPLRPIVHLAEILGVCAVIFAALVLPPLLPELKALVRRKP